MSIWIKNKLAPYNYERSLLGLSNLVVWVEGTKGIKFSTQGKGFGIAGGPVWTNYGIQLTKEQLLDLANQMNDGSILKICYPDQYISTRKKPYRDEKPIEDVFEESNKMIQVSDNGFMPIDKVKENIDKVHPDYLEYVKRLLLDN